jgi:hypothetical protein
MFLDLRFNFCDTKSIISVLNFLQFLRFPSVQWLTLQCWRTALKTTHMMAVILTAYKQFICSFISWQALEKFYCASNSMKEDWMVLVSNIQIVLMWCLSECTPKVSFCLVILKSFVWQHSEQTSTVFPSLTLDAIHVVKGRDQFYVDKKKKYYTLRLI